MGSVSLYMKPLRIEEHVFSFLVLRFPRWCKALNRTSLLMKGGRDTMDKHHLEDIRAGTIRVHRTICKQTWTTSRALSVQAARSIRLKHCQPI